MCTLRVALVILMLFTSAAGNAQFLPGLPPLSPTCNDIQACLGSDDPRIVAWGAYVASIRNDDADLPMLLRLVDRWNMPKRAATPQDYQKIAAMSAVLDAVIQTGHTVSAARLTSIAEIFPAQALIFASRHPVSEVAPLLLAQYNRRKRSSNEDMARIAAMMLAKAPPKGFAASVLAESEEQMFVSVVSKRSTVHLVPGIGCGDGFGGGEPAGWPPLFDYAFEENSGRKDLVLVQAGGDRITCIRHASGGWGSCHEPRPLTSVTRHHLLAEMLGQNPKSTQWQAHQFVTLQWKSRNQFRRDLHRQIAEEEAKIKNTVRALYAKKLLTETEVQSVQPKLSVTVSDERGTPDSLPRLVPRYPRVTINFYRDRRLLYEDPQ